MELIFELVRQNAFTVRRLWNVALCFVALMLAAEAVQLLALGAFDRGWSVAVTLLTHRTLSDVVIALAGMMLAFALKASGMGAGVPPVKWGLGVVTLVGGAYANLVHCGTIDAALSLVATGNAAPPAHIVCLVPLVQWAIVPSAAYWASSRLVGRHWHALH
jgi:hypothetical protein